MRRLFAVPGLRGGWQVVDEADRVVWPGVVYLTKRLAVAAIRAEG